MNIQEIVVDNKKSYLVLNNGQIVKPPTLFIKYLYNVGKSPNTLKTYATALKYYYEYLEQINKDFDKVTLDDLSNFVGWIQIYNNNSKVTRTKYYNTSTYRSPSTVNLYTTAITSFYDYLYRSQQFSSNISEILMRNISNASGIRRKGFLEHGARKKAVRRNVLKVKVPKRKLTVLAQEEVQQLYDACTNFRDKFLIRMLLETGIRIGELLALFTEDIICDHKNGHRIRLVDRGYHPNGGALKSGEREVHISQELLDLYDDYIFEVLDELDIISGYLFIKIKGNNAGAPLQYTDVNSLMKRLKKKTGIDVHAHLFRHTHATWFYENTGNLKAIQERLGHKSYKTTCDLYLHPTDAQKMEEFSKIKDIFNISTTDQ